MITNAGLEHMGFHPLPPGETVTAAFHLVRVYAIQGFSLKDTPPQLYSGPGYRIGIGNSLNDISQLMLGDGFVEDEPSWREKHKVSPPFIVIHVGPTPVATVHDGFAQRKDGVLLTYDCFPQAKADLARREAEVVEPVLASLSIAFSDFRHPVEFLACGREIFGETSGGEAIHDLKLRMSATLTVSSPLSVADLERRIEHSVHLQKHLDPDINRFYYLGLSEGDPLKRFLYFFLFLERYTHRVFRRLLDQDAHRKFFNVPSRLAKAGADLSEEILRSAKSLTERFMWCALVAWTGLQEEDIVTFVKLKRERDRISHGERTTVDKSLAEEARALSARIVLCDAPRDQGAA